MIKNNPYKKCEPIYMITTIERVHYDIFYKSCLLLEIVVEYLFFNIGCSLMSIIIDEYETYAICHYSRAPQ